MSNGTCAAITTPGTEWNFCPSKGAAIAFLALFALALAVQVAQGIHYRKAYTWVICMSALWQTATYVLRVLSINNPTVSGDYIGWFVLIFISPLWTNAFVYMVFARMVWNYIPSASIRGIRAWQFSMYFVMFDIVSFIIQTGGAVYAQKNGNTDKQILDGLHIYMGGVGLQQLFIFIFGYFAFEFWRGLRRQRKAGGIAPALNNNNSSKGPSLASGFKLLYTLVVVLLLITLRILFRLAEYSHGLKSSIPNHEVYQYCLDSVSMFLCFVILSIVHPGAIMRGPECEIPSRKQRKREGLLSKGGASFYGDSSQEIVSA